MSTFQYDRINGTPQKREQNNVGKFADAIQRKLLQKVLDFIGRV